MLCNKYFTSIAYHIKISGILSNINRKYKYKRNDLSFEVFEPAKSVRVEMSVPGRGAQPNNNTFLSASSQTVGVSLQPPQCPASL